MHLLALLTLFSCGREISETDIKMVGVGYHPDEIGPEPDYFGGYIEYDYVNFAGGGLSLGGLGLVVYDEVGVGLNGFTPPYAAVYGLAFIFDEQVPAPDAHHGNIGVAPAVTDRDACWTNFEPFSYLMASTVEMGDHLSFQNEDGSVEFEMGRNPEIYPPDPQDVFVYYIEVQAHHADPLEAWLPDQSERQTLRAANWRHGETMQLVYPGGMPPREAPVSSIPLPSTSEEAQFLTLPNATSGLALSWSGPAYQGDGTVLAAGPYATCVRYLGDPSGDFDVTSCSEDYTVPGNQEEYPGQIYTGPWDTSDGSVTFSWEPGSNPDEVVTLNIRFLGPVDRQAESFVSAQVPITDESIIEDEWSSNESIPVGYRDALACDDPEDVVWNFDPTYETSDGELVTALQGDPSKNLAEVSCRLMDDGEFQLTNEHLARALEYASVKGGEGAVFYFSRSTDLDATVPPVKDQANYKRDIGQVKVRAHTVDMGRFWVSGTESFDQGLN